MFSEVSCQFGSMAEFDTHVLLMIFYKITSPGEVSASVRDDIRCKGLIYSRPFIFKKREYIYSRLLRYECEHLSEGADTADIAD